MSHVMQAGDAIIEELIGSLCSQVEAAEEKAQRWGQELIAERKRANDAVRALAEAIEALRPFAKIVEGVHPSWDDNRRAYSLALDPLKLKHLRRAFALVAVADAKALTAAGTAALTPGEPA